MTKLTFKKIDFWLQITGLLVFFSSALIYFSTTFSAAKYFSFIFVILFLISFWQVISAIINFFWLKIHSKSRQFWQIISAFLVFLILIAGFSFNPLYAIEGNNLFTLLFGLVFYFLHFALFLSPFLAIWYLTITWSELKEMEKIELGK